MTACVQEPVLLRRGGVGGWRKTVQLRACSSLESPPLTQSHPPLDHGRALPSPLPPPTHRTTAARTLTIHPAPPPLRHAHTHTRTTCSRAAAAAVAGGSRHATAAAAAAGLAEATGRTGVQGVRVAGEKGARGEMGRERVCAGGGGVIPLKVLRGKGLCRRRRRWPGKAWGKQGAWGHTDWRHTVKRGQRAPSLRPIPPTSMPLPLPPLPPSPPLPPLTSFPSPSLSLSLTPLPPFPSPSLPFLSLSLPPLPLPPAHHLHPTSTPPPPRSPRAAVHCW